MEVPRIVGSKAKYHHLDLKVGRLGNDRLHITVSDLGKLVTSEECQGCSLTTAQDKAVAIAYGYLLKDPSGIIFHEYTPTWEPIKE